MRQAILTALLAVTLIPPSAGTSPAGEAQPQLVVAEGAAHPCTFFRGQAHRMGMTHFLTEMLWACEAIVERRAAGMTLSDRLLATERALLDYRSALGAARASAGANGGSPLSVSETRKREIAEATGVLGALEAISAGF
jgi:hypothetical protein